MVHEAPIPYLLARQKERQRMEQRSLASILAASLGLGCLMSWLLGKPALIVPWTAGPALLLFWLLRALGDAGSLYQLMIGGAWREIRLSRVRAAQVVDGITFQGLRGQMGWAVGAAILLGSYDARWGLPWLGAVLAGSVLGSFYGQIAVVQRIIPRPPLSPRDVALFCFSGGLLFFGIGTLGPGLMLLPGLLWVAALLRCCAAASLDAIPEGHMMASSETPVGARKLQWLPWSDNPIVARECARESFRLGSGWLSSFNHFAGWGMLLAIAPAGMLWMFTRGESLLGWREGGVYYLTLYVLYCGLLQAGRASNRVFRALSEERDRQTLDTLVVTALQPEDFVDGWAQVGYVSRQFEMALITAAGVGTGVLLQASLYELSFIAYAGLVGLVMCVAGSYLGLLLGFRHCMRIKRKRDWVFPAAVCAWMFFSAPLYEYGLLYLPVQAAAAYLIARSARAQALRAMSG